MGSRRYLLSKTLQAVVTLWFVLTFNFFLFRILPGDPIAMLARSEKLTPDDVARLQHDQGLDRPLLQQYFVYMGNVVTLNFGESLITGEQVKHTMGIRMWPTVLLVGLGTLLATYVGILIGIRGGWQRGSAFDTSTQYGSLILYSMPEAWLGMLLLLVFSGWLHWFPAGGYASGSASGIAHIVDVANHLFLPLLTLTLGYIGSYAIIMRSSMIESMHEDFVLTARAKGVPERQVRKRHVVPNAFLPAFTTNDSRAEFLQACVASNSSNFFMSFFTRNDDDFADRTRNVERTHRVSNYRFARDHGKQFVESHALTAAAGDDNGAKHGKYVTS